MLKKRYLVLLLLLVFSITIYGSHEVIFDSVDKVVSTFQGDAILDAIGQTGNDGSGDITTSLVASRISGAAPLAVHFDASATTSISHSRPFHELDYVWSFGDSGAGNWATSGDSKNFGRGPVTSHVFETPGTYLVTLNANDGKGKYDSTDVTITVTDPDTVFSGTSTYCFSNDAVFTGCPTGATQVITNNFNTAMSNIGSNRRLLFERGNTFNTSATSTINAIGPGIVGAYGAGTRPHIPASSNDMLHINVDANDWRIFGLHFEGLSPIEASEHSVAVDMAANRDNILVLDNEVENMNTGLGGSGGIGKFLFWIENDVHEIGTNGAFVSGDRMAVMGNSIQRVSLSHVLRVVQAKHSVISHNNLKYPSFNNPAQGRHSLKMHIDKDWYPGDTTDHVYIYRNNFNGDRVSVSVGPQDTASNEFVNDIIFEGNLFEGKNAQVALVIDAQDITVRNNIFNANEASMYYKGISLIADSVVTRPMRNIDIFNNVFIKTNGWPTQAGSEFTFLEMNAGQNVRVKNNIISISVAASWNPLIMLGNLALRNELDEGNNMVNLPVTNYVFDWSVYQEYTLAQWQALGEGTGSFRANPGFVSSTDLHLRPISLARDNGTATPVISDYDGNSRPLGPGYDIGAYEFTPSLSCNNGLKQNCVLQQGVCNGAQETCASNVWPGCDATTYLAYNSSYEVIEVTFDGQDNDCDGSIDEGTQTCAQLSGNICQATYTCDGSTVQSTEGDCCVGTCNPPSLGDSLVYWYKLDETNGATNFLDSSTPSSNNATCTGTACPSMVSGRIENAASFDGVNDYIDLNKTDLIGSEMSIALWFNSADLFNCGSGDCNLVSKATGVAVEDHYWMISTVSSTGIKLRFRLKAGGTTNEIIATTGDLADNTWTHVVATYDGAEMVLYKGGVEVGRTPQTGTIDVNDTIDAWIGGNPENMISRPWDGMIDDVRIYNKALDLNEISSLVSVGSGSCSFNAAWNTTSAISGDPVELILQGVNCDGLIANFTILENDIASADDPVNTNPPTATFVGGQAKTTWISEWQCDGDILGVCTLGNPEYYFDAELVSDSNINANSGTGAASLLVVTEAAATCGNGLIQGAETCDDGNTANNDGCSSTCAIESGYTCTGEPSVCSASGGNIVADINASRITGVAPLAVFFDGTATTGLEDGYLHPEFEWEFGDSPSGTWSISGKSKNMATGFLSAHMYENPGTYTVNMNVTDIDGDTGSATPMIITVTGFSSANTRCVSTGTDFTGCPSGSVQVTSTDFNSQITWVSGAANRRLLFRGGDSWTSTGFDIGVAGPGMVGAFGTGRAMVDATGSLLFTGNDWRFDSFDVHCNHGAICVGFEFGSEFITGNNLNLHGGNSFAGNQVGFGSGGRYATLVDSTVIDTNYFGAYDDGFATAIIGSYIDQLRGATSFGWAPENSALRYYAHNQFDASELRSNPTSGIKWHARKGVITDNIFTAGTMRISLKNDGCGANCPVDAGIGTVLIERNLFFPGTHSDEVGLGRSSGITADEPESNVVIRNNLFYAMPMAFTVSSAPVYNFSFYHNTIYSDSQTTGVNADEGSFLSFYYRPTNMQIKNNLFVDVRSNEHQIMIFKFTDFSGINISNNLYYSPNYAPSFNVMSSWYDTAGWFGLGHDTNSFFANPLFLSTVSSNADFLKIDPTSPAIDAGVNVNVNVMKDFERANRPQGSGYDIGAYENGSGVVVPVCGNGIIQSGETCDDGNTANNDGCSATCAIESGYTCTGEPSVCTLIGACTNGAKQNCAIQVGVCSSSNETCAANAWPGCGITEYNYSGNYETVEVSCDGLDNDCDGSIDEGVCAVCTLTSAVWNTTSTPSGYSVDLILQGTNCDSEQANFTIWEDDAVNDDLANVQPTVGSFSSGEARVSWNAEWQCDGEVLGVCTAGNPEYYFDAFIVSNPSIATTSGTAANLELDVSEGTATCGNGLIQGAETCDDGNTANSDGCSSTCTIESGYTCTGEPSVCTVSSGAVTADINVSRITGVAPLAVHFDASGTTSTATTRPFHEIDYSWNFGDASSGNWATTGNSKNSARGPLSVHVFETPGTYTITLNVDDLKGGKDSSTVIVTVTDPNTVFSGTNTICVSNDVVFTGCPSGASQITSADLDSVIINNFAPGIRMLFNRGDRFVASQNIPILANSGPGIIGAFGACTSPNVRGICANNPEFVTPLTGDGMFATNRVNDIRFMDIHATGATSFSYGFRNVVEVLNLRLDIDVTAGSGMWLSFWDTTGHNLWSLIDSELIAAGSNQAYVGSERIGILGNKLADSDQSHVLRVWQGYKGVISNNDISGSSLTSGTGRHALKLHGPSESIIGCGAVGGVLCQRTDQVVITENIFGGSGPWPVAIGPQDSGEDERLTNIIFDGNKILANYGNQGNSIQISMMVWAREVTVRNNIFDGTGSGDGYSGISIGQRGVEPRAQGVRVYNNNFYNFDAQPSNGIDFVMSNSVDLTPVVNNIFYGPNAQILNGAVGRVSGSNNLLGPNPLFVDATNANALLRNFNVAPTSPAIDAGISVQVGKDFEGANRPQGSAYDIGAYENGSGIVVPVCGNGAIEAGETCDDGNTANNDGCSSTCTIESGYTCVGAPSVCTLIGACTNGAQQNCVLQAGVCSGAQETCTASSWPGCGVAEYNTGGNYETVETSCDGLDNDCDGSIDEGCISPNTPPEIAPIPNKIVVEMQLVQFQVNGRDNDSDPITFSASGLPIGATFVPATRIFSWRPSLTQAGDYQIEFMVSDGIDNDTTTANIRVHDSADTDGDGMPDIVDCNDNDITIGRCSGCAVCSDPQGVSGSCVARPARAIDCRLVDHCGIGGCAVGELATFEDKFSQTCSVVGDVGNWTPLTCQATSCTETPSCSLDGDGDGVMDRDDRCPNTPLDRIVSLRNGCSLSTQWSKFHPEYTTNFSDVLDLHNVSNLSLGIRNMGKINFFNQLFALMKYNTLGTRYEPLSLEYIRIEKNRIEIDTANSTLGFSSFNRSATLTLFNITYTNPRILRDGVVCADCTKLSYANGEFQFSVKGFSVYTLEETPTDSGTTTSSSSGGGGGGGGGGSPTVTTTPPSSLPDTPINVNLDKKFSEEIKVSNDALVYITFNTNLYSVKLSGVQGGVLTLKTNPRSETLKLEVKKMLEVEIDKDEGLDIEMTLLAIEGSDVRLKIDRIIGKGSSVEPADDIPRFNPISDFIKNNLWMIIWGALGGFAVAILVTLQLRKRKTSKKSSKKKKSGKGD